MYIGKIPTVGNFQKCDAITESSTATYNLTVGSVAVFPETANNCIVSLNGVIQAPTDAYTIVGSTIVFNSALTSADVIDFILILGNVLDIGTPSDATVSTAKVANDAITLAKMASGTDGNVISYDASGNPVAIATGSDGQVLTSTGAGSPPAFEAVSAGGTLTSKSATASGAAVDITGIPAGTKWITILLNSVGSNGTGAFGVAIGDSGGIETSGYNGNCSGANGTNVATGNAFSADFRIINVGLSAEAYVGIIHLRLFEASSYTWVQSGLVSDDLDSATTWFSAGRKALSAELTQIRILTADTFDEGNISIQYGE